MIYKHKNNTDVDLGETIPNLHIDLEKAVENHVIRDTGIIPEFNGIETPDDVGPVIRDTFQAKDEQNRIMSMMRETAHVQKQQSAQSTNQEQTSQLS